jgi:hypothetical protein
MAANTSQILDLTGPGGQMLRKESVLIKHCLENEDNKNSLPLSLFPEEMQSTIQDLAAGKLMGQYAPDSSIKLFDVKTGIVLDYLLVPRYRTIETIAKWGLIKGIPEVRYVGNTYNSAGPNNDPRKNYVDKPIPENLFNNEYNNNYLVNNYYDPETGENLSYLIPKIKPATKLGKSGKKRGGLRRKTLKRKTLKRKTLKRK